MWDKAFYLILNIISKLPKHWMFNKDMPIFNFKDISK